MTTKMLVWAKGSGDRKGEASMVARFTYAGARPATQVAREIDAEGQDAIDRNECTADYPLNGYTPARRHGVTIQYASGRIRTVRA